MPASLPVIHHPAYEVNIGMHVFVTAKFRLVRERLIEDGTIKEANILVPEPAIDEDVALVHTPEYVEKITTGRLSHAEEMMLEVPFTVELREAMWLCAGGSALTGRTALEHGIASHLGGGFHHAFADHGEGFCLINDVAVAIRVLQRDKAIERAMVIDLDVHHGNGTAAIFADDPTVFTFSMHQQNNYPALKPPSDLDVGLPDRIGDAEYLGLLEKHLPPIVEEHRPDLAYYLAGADPYVQDQLGGLGLTLDGLRRRDRLVLEILGKARVPVATMTAGGYAINPSDTVEIHANTVREGKSAFSSPDWSEP
ncbi:MAG: histone deacetylase [Gemmatimonadales bacterium]|nr:histone deacetylase [Gemmatimonadales bacterium]